MFTSSSARRVRTVLVMPTARTEAKKEITEFARSLGESYRRLCTEAAVAFHWQLSNRREGPVELGIFEQFPDLTGVCIVAADRPGLLLHISEALVVCGLDVHNAEAFTRSGKHGAEAVDLFWLRRMTPEGPCPLGEADVMRLRNVLLGLLDGSLSAEQTPLTPQREQTSSNTRVRFIEDDEGSLTTLEIETEDRSGLLLSLSRALYAQHVQIVRSEVKTVGRHVIDRFKVAELDGSPVQDGRRLEIQVAVLSAAEPAKRLMSSSPPPPSSGAAN